ncbi:MAG: ABC transporter ATP-binding protein [Planctomycetaceae bacterium]|nr:ABC transporter ATP-binding protein [Planctomycetaceae bacterium]
MTSDAIVVENLGKRYSRRNPNRPRSIHEALLRGLRGLRSTEDFWALRNVSFRVPRGSMLGVIGRNGAGKSTLLRLLGGLESPDEGSITRNGHVGALLSLGAGFHPDLTGRENVFVSAVIHGLTRAEVRRKFDSIVDFAEVGEFIDDPVRIYSSGMQMRLRFAVAIHMQPEILLIDEVLSVGDQAFQEKCLARIRQIMASGGTIVLITHSLDQVRQMCDQAVWLHGGHVCGHGDPELTIEKYLDASNGQMSKKTTESQGLYPRPRQTQGDVRLLSGS